MKNIVLIGMMGCGKTTVGTLLAQRLGRAFVDCDQLIEGFTGRTISDIFATDGEEAFRTLEQQTLEELSHQQDLVIATGGGAVLSQHNVSVLREGGTLVFLNRPLEDIWNTLEQSTRPLAQGGFEEFSALYRHRLPTYRTASDVMVFDFSSPHATVEEILHKVEVTTKKFLIINGPNLNLLGKREPGIYGEETYASLCRMIEDYAKAHNATATCFQSNHEGAIIDEIHASDGVYDAIIINPGAYTHYSYAILDALKGVSTPAFEVHISDIHAREPFRAISVTAPACVGQIYGQGLKGYLMAMDYFLKGGN